MQQTRVVTRDDVLKSLPEEKKADYIKKCRKSHRRRRFNKIRHWLFNHLFDIIQSVVATAALIIAIIALVE